MYPSSLRDADPMNFASFLSRNGDACQAVRGCVKTEKFNFIIYDLKAFVL